MDESIKDSQNIFVRTSNVRYQITSAKYNENNLISFQYDSRSVHPNEGSIHSASESRSELLSSDASRNIITFPIYFSKTYITGEVHPSMPHIVLKEIAFENDIILSLERVKNDVKYWAKMFKKIVNIKPRIIEDIKFDRFKIISIVNPFELNWTDESLERSLEHLIEDHQDLVEDYLTQTALAVGLQTNENPKSFNECKLYSICQKKKIQVPLDASIEDMYFLLKREKERETEREKERETEREIEREKEREIEREEKNRGKTLDDSETRENFNIFSEITNLQNEADLLSDIEYLRKMFQPKNNVQAIIIGALVFNKDFSKYSNPLDEFYFTSRSKKPIPFHFRNPNFTDLNMYFNPYLPRNAYSSEILDHHISLFSYQESDFFPLSSYFILQELHLENNFYLGFHPNIKNVETPIHLDMIDSLKSEEIVCFGVREEFLNAATWRELKDCFENTKMFTNPFEKKRIFSKDQIDRLYKLGRWILSSHENIASAQKHKYLFETYSPEILTEIKECLFVINQIKLIDSHNFEFLKDKVLIFNSRSPKEKDIILSGFEKLFELSMFMRGWNKSNELPIEHSYTTDTEESQKRIIECIFELDEINKNTHDFIYGLPLMLWKGEFVQSLTIEQGLSIGDRIDIVKRGETDGIYSCVRMTSNVLGSSYYFYCNYFNITNPKSN